MEISTVYYFELIHVNSRQCVGFPVEVGEISILNKSDRYKIVRLVD